MHQILTLYFLLITLSGFSQTSDQVIYKRVDSTVLTLDIYYPDSKTGIRYPAMVFFFGGGWNSGNISQFVPHAKYFAARGIVCFLADYRVNNRHGTTPFESLKDAKSAIRFIRENAAKYQVDTGKIIAAGGSAGGHLAAATALVRGYNESSDDLSISCIPNALVLFNPVIDNSPEGYGYDRIGKQYMEFSPLHSIRAGAPPTIFFLGTKDKLIPVETAERYKSMMEEVGSTCELHLYEEQGHGFFNFRNSDFYTKTVRVTDYFLGRLGYLAGEPTITRK